MQSSKLQFIEADFSARLLVSLLTFPLLIHFSVALFLALDLMLWSYSFVLAGIMFVVVLYLLFRDSFLSIFFTSLIVISATIAVAIFFQDFNYDSRVYHLPASVMIYEGWNPFNNVTAPLVSSTQIVHFPKGQWFINASLLGFFSSIEAGKFTHLLYIICSILAGILVAKKFYPGLNVILMTGLVLGLNPVALSQSTLNYVDGALASLISTLLFLQYAILRCNCRILYTAAAICSVLLVSLKTTGLVYVLLSWAIVFTFLIWRSANKTVAIKKVSKVGVLVFAFALLINWNPYVTNTIEKGNPIHPIITGEKILSRDFLDGYNRFETFVISYTSAPRILNSNKGTISDQWLNPLQKKNIFDSYFPPALGRTIGGLGPLWILIFCSSLVWMFFSSFEYKVIFSIVMLTTFLHTEGWHARYTPQLWVIVPLFALDLTRKLKQEQSKKVAVLIVFLITIINSYLFLYSWPKPQYKSKWYLENVSTLKNASEEEKFRVKSRFLPGNMRTSKAAFMLTENKRMEYILRRVDANNEK